MGNFEATFESLSQHAVPAWFDDAKLGIFVHWTAATVPAYAPLTDDPFTLGEQHGRASRHLPMGRRHLALYDRGKLADDAFGEPRVGGAGPLGRQGA